MIENGVAVVGMGALFPDAEDVNAYWQNISKGIDSFKKVPESRWQSSYYDPTNAKASRFYCNTGAFVDDIAHFDPASFGIMPVAVDHTEPDQLIALKSAAEAIEDAGGVDSLSDDGEKVGVILGRGGYYNAGMVKLDQRVRVQEQVIKTIRETFVGISQEDIDKLVAAFNSQLGDEHPEAMIGLVPNLAASRIANRFDFSGPAYTVDAACASSLVAIDHAVNELLSNRLDVVITGGTHHCHDVTFWSVFTQLKALSISGMIRPFDKRADGLLIGEGTGIVVLERLGDALKKNHRIYAVIRGVGVASDGRDTSLMKPKVSGQLLALERAWKAANLDPMSVGLVEAHGTATPAGDRAELETLGTFFGLSEKEVAEDLNHPSRINLGSVKSMIGHTMAAAGIAGFIKAVLALYYRKVPPSLHCEEPNLALKATRFKVPSQLCDFEQRDTPYRAGINAFGFGGINAHVVLEEFGDRKDVKKPSASFYVSKFNSSPIKESDIEVDGVFYISSNDVKKLREKVSSYSPNEVIDRSKKSFSDQEFDKAHQFKLAIVDPTEKKISLASKIIDNRKPWRGRSDIFFTSKGLLDDSSNKIGYVFPGVEPTFKPNLDRVAKVLNQPQIEELTSIVGFKAAQIINAGRLLDAALSKCQIEPDIVAGHSIGELSAVLSAGIIPNEEYDEFIEGMDLAAVAMPNTLFGAIGSSAEVVAAKIGDLKNVVISHDNCPHQVIVCGDELEVREVLRRLKHEKIMCQELPFRSGFHSPMFEPYLEPIMSRFMKLKMDEPLREIWSATVANIYPKGEELKRELAIRHLLEPVRFRELTENLYENGVKIFVQVGVGSLTGFIDDTLQKSEHLSIEAANEKRDGLNQLRRLVAGLVVEGHKTASFESLFSGNSERAKRNHGNLLKLGNPLISLNERIFVNSKNSDGNVDISGSLSREIKEFHTLQNEASSDILRMLSSPSRKERALRDRRRSIVKAQYDGVTEVEDERSRRLKVSLETMPWLKDHAFFHQPTNWAEMDDYFPVVPMTNNIEIMKSEALRVCPHLKIVELKSVRALRWTAAVPGVEIPIKTTMVSNNVAKVSLEGYVRANAIYANSYSPSPSLSGLDLLNSSKPAITAFELYDQRFMFHGPAYQGVHELLTIGDDGISALLIAKEAPGSLLDAAGQLVGYYNTVSSVENQMALPSTITSITYFRDHPDVGEILQCNVRVTEKTDDKIVADIEIGNSEGLWCKIEGWEERRFTTTPVLFQSFLWPEKQYISTEIESGVRFLKESWNDAATRELVMRNFTNNIERKEYESLNPKEQREWLISRVAAKDAVRSCVVPLVGRHVYPSELTISHNDLGAPQVISEIEEANSVQISIGHKNMCAVSFANGNNRVGVDIELVEPRSERFAKSILTEKELKLLHAREPDLSYDEVVTALWSAKETLSKLKGTGLEGKPKSFEIDSLNLNNDKVSSSRNQERNELYVDEMSDVEVSAQIMSKKENEIVNGNSDIEILRSFRFYSGEIRIEVRKIEIDKENYIVTFATVE